MTRPIWKELFFNPKLEKHISNSQLKTWYRHSNIPNSLIGMKLKIHNGIKFIDLNITNGMVGHKLGEFANTRKRFIFKSKKEKKKK